MYLTCFFKNIFQLEEVVVLKGPEMYVGNTSFTPIWSSLTPLLCMCASPWLFILCHHLQNLLPLFMPHCWLVTMYKHVFYIVFANACVVVMSLYNAMTWLCHYAHLMNVCNLVVTPTVWCLDSSPGSCCHKCFLIVILSFALISHN